MLYDDSMTEPIFEEKVEEKKTVFSRVKDFASENLDVIIVGAATIIFAGGAAVGSRSATKQIGRGLDVMNNVGFIRYFDRDGKEIFGDDAVRRAMEIAEDIRAK